MNDDVPGPTWIGTLAVSNFLSALKTKAMWINIFQTGCYINHPTHTYRLGIAKERRGRGKSKEGR